MGAFKFHKKSILWLDCLGGLIVGTIVLFIRQPLSTWEGLPVETVVAMGIANLFYGCYSLFVTCRTPRPILPVKVLAFANVAWLFICLAVIGMNWSQFTPIGLTLVTGEGLYVATLGYMEWRWRHELGDPA